MSTILHGGTSQPDKSLDRFARWQARAREPGLTVLLALELLAIFVFIPLWGLSVYRLGSLEVSVAALVIVAAIAAIAPGRGWVILMIAVSAISVATVYLRAVVPTERSEVIYLLAALSFLTVITVIVGILVFRGGRVTAHRVQGAIVVYLHLALIFVYLYGLLLVFAPSAFGEALVATDASVGAKLVYFSFTTLATVGYGDIVPLHPFARSLANLEGIVGQLYPATLLARIVTLEVAGRGK
jgi:hypothetical protein